ncbi:VOC family protein [Streptomyces beigongshangae]|uniref:VOC family protein n=1 Tax=Streptomyces beigongshangae TaxID=2841597 RepID=UPI001C858FDA|nr:lactoylglutathione lyase [Streptomyces sp. REN17]
MTVPQRPADPERWFRTRPDSSTLARPRLLARSLIALPDLDEHIGHYENLLGVPADLRMPIPDFGGLELAAVGNLLLIASSRPFTPIQRRTRYSLIVPHLQRQLDLLDGTGTTVLEPPEPILPGARARVRYPDGTLAELVEHRPWPGERPRTAVPGTVRTGPRATGIRLLARHAVADEDFPATVRLYENLLQTPAHTPTRLTGPGAVRTATVGNLLVVGLPTTPADVAQPRTALIMPAHTLAPPTTADTPVLAGNVAAELWSESVQDTFAPPRPVVGPRPGAGHA